MKASLALSILACVISTTAKSIHHRRADSYLPAAAIPKGGYNAYGGNYDHPETNQFQPVGQKQTSSSDSSSSTTNKDTTTDKKATTQSTKCISKGKLESIVNKYVSTFSGITDGGDLAKTIFQDNVKFYSQSIWWTASSKKINKYAKVSTLLYTTVINHANIYFPERQLPSRLQEPQGAYCGQY
jgi:hypothetical protein